MKLIIAVGLVFTVFVSIPLMVLLYKIIEAEKSKCCGSCEYFSYGLREEDGPQCFNPRSVCFGSMKSRAGSCDEWTQLDRWEE